MKENNLGRNIAHDGILQGDQRFRRLDLVDVCCFIGIILKSAKDYPSALARLESLEEVVEAYYTTGHYSIFIKVMTRSIDALQHVLINKIQTIDEIQSTETLISLQNPIMRYLRYCH